MRLVILHLLLVALWLGAWLTQRLCSLVVARRNGKCEAKSIWSSTKAKTAVENAFGHWEKHKGEFPEFQNAKQYVEGAKNFFESPPPGTLTKINSYGDKLFYNPASNTFGVQSANGAPRTLFRPTDGINYWNRQ